jgi:hypothetical protein
MGIGLTVPQGLEVELEQLQIRRACFAIFLLNSDILRYSPVVRYALALVALVHGQTVDDGTPLPVAHTRTELLLIAQGFRFLDRWSPLP